MASVVRPLGGEGSSNKDPRLEKRPNVASANVQLPAVFDYEQVDYEVAATLNPTGKWFAALGLAIACMLWGAGTWVYQIYWGLGNAGYAPPVMWGTYIITFVFWVGIGHAGTLISAILYLFRAGFRTTIYRCAEAMTVFAVMTAGLFPIIHIGRPWKFFWLLPYPNWRLLWPQFKSPLVWDVFAISTYLTISTTFLYIGLIPDIATLRDRETSPVRKRILGALSLGWRNSDREWRHFAKAYLFLAALSTPLVLSVHSVVSFDFAMALTPGWHATIFPPYFVAGAIFSGIGMVFTIIIPIRKWFNLKHYVTINHLDAAAKLCLFTSMVVGAGYMSEFFIAWFSGNAAEQEYFWQRVFGQWWWAAWILLTCNMILPMSLWSQGLRRNTTWLWILSIFINIGMWYERFVIVVPSLSHEFEPWQWTSYVPSWVDMSFLLGSFGWFFMWFLLFVKQLPVIAIAEVKEIVPPKLRMVHEHDSDDRADATGRHYPFSPSNPGERD
jgi:Ni/Fe-hydrogenase subunit HybB-like protein